MRNLLVRNRFRAAALASGVWAGVLLGIALLGTPAGFALFPAPMAGKLAGHMLGREAWLSVGLCVLLFPLVRQQAREAAVSTGGSVMSTNVLLVLGALFCTVFGHFALQPAMEAARAGQGRWSFGTLHAVSVVAFGIKTLLVLSLAWRFSAPGTRQVGGNPPPVSR
jgi:hypothetical protein